jgi:hypothetical protein
MAVTIEGAAAGLNRYAIQYKGEINTKMRQSLVTESEWTPRVADHTWTAPNVTTTDLIQAFQCDFTPNNSHTFDETPIPLQQLKIDLQFTCDDLEKFFDSFFTEWYEFGSGKKPEDWRFPAWIYANEILPKVEEELELLIAYKGVLVAPTTGVAGTPSASCDGMARKIALAIIAGRITPIATGAFTANTYYDKVNTFISALPQQHRERPGKIYMAPTHARGLAMDILERFKANSNINPADTNSILRYAMPFSNKKIVGLPSMEGTSRIIYSPRRDNLVWVRKRNEPTLPMVRWESFERKLKGYAEFHRGYGFEFGPEMYVNDQA